MTTYYVDPVNGSNSNNGLGPDASHATNKPWLTIAKAVGASGAASGDTIYLSPSGPYREQVTFSLAPTAETKILGDPGNVQGFKTSGGVRVTPGPIVWTSYLTNDKTAATNARMLDATSKNFFTFQYITFILAGNNTHGIAFSSTNWKFLDCAFIPGGLGYLSGGATMQCTVAFNTPANLTIDRCLFYRTGNTGDGTIKIILTTGVGADFDANVAITNSVFTGGVGTAIIVVNSGTSANKGGGVRARNCSHYGSANFMNAGAASQLSTSIPCVVDNCYLNTGTTAALVAGTSGQITEDYNLIISNGGGSSNGRTNVTAGTHSISDGSYAPLFLIGQERQWGMAQRAYGVPMQGSPLLGYGNDGSQTSYDGHNNPRPAGGASASPAVGAYERGNTWGQETTTVRTGSNAISITGPGYQDFDLPVDATSTTVTVYLRYDSTYAGTRPQFSVLNGEECGVTAASVTASTSALNGWEQQTLTFTPTSKGIVTLRVQSNDTNGGGKAFADDFNVA